VARFTVYQVHLHLGGDCEHFENNSLKDGYLEQVEFDREVFAEMGDIPTFAEQYQSHNHNRLTIETHRQRLLDLRKQFTGSEELIDDEPQPTIVETATPDPQRQPEPPTPDPSPRLTKEQHAEMMRKLRQKFAGDASE
jgi:hypothetical protein